VSNDTQISPMAQQLGQQLPLKDIHLPADITAWPPAPGWWLLAALALLVIALLVRYWLRRQRHPVTEALRQLRQIEQRAADSDSADVARACTELVRRTALSLYPRAEVASLTGEPWQHFLCLTSVKKPAGEAEVAALHLAVLQPRPEFDQQAVFSWLRGWLKAQRSRPVREVADV